MARAGGITNAVNVGIAVQADWENREFISHISLNVRQLFDFLVQFAVAIPGSYEDYCVHNIICLPFVELLAFCSIENLIPMQVYTN
ncbi:hypothetical protein E3N88_39018 [Mikania micrantha]|uniref:Uncharacterized protein n=1 Tax=Mikania micrantha TaxID=192012 RepID=A0A5N6LVT9_9ASTR|nr:hypothetical protein E3N88_39018 [Mikania micrantha]